MRSSRDRISNSPPRPARSCSTTRTSCSRTATAGRRRSLSPWRSRRRTGDGIRSTDWGRSHPNPPPWTRGRERPARVGRGPAGHAPMILSAIMFYVFAALAIASGVMVVSARNPVHSVLFLILAFFNAAGLFVLMGAEFLAMILVIVYVGAVAVLFLFVVMMLDIDFAQLRTGAMKYLPVGALVGFILVAELIFVFGSWVIAPGVAGVAAAPLPAGRGGKNTPAAGAALS